MIYAHWLIFASLICSSAFAVTENPLTFSEALKTLKTTNTNLEAQRLSVNSAQAVKTAASANFLPRLSLSAERDHFGKSYAEDTTDLDKYSLNASLNVFHFGADAAKFQTAKYELIAEALRLRSTELKTEKAIVSALVGIIQASQQLEVQQTRDDYVKKLLEIARLRFRRGVLSQQEVDQVTIDASNADASVVDAQSKLNLAESVLVSLSEKASLDPARIEKMWPWKNKFSSPAVRALASRKPDVDKSVENKVSEATTQAAVARKKQLARNILPSLDLSYSQDWFRGDEGKTDQGWSTMLKLSVPIFNGLQDYTTYKVQSYVVATASLEQRQALRDAEIRQNLAQKNFLMAYSTAVEREKNLLLAKRLLDSSLERFRAGRANADALAFDQNRLTQAQSLAVDGWAQAHLNLTELAHAFGLSVEELN